MENKLLIQILSTDYLNSESLHKMNSTFNSTNNFMTALLACECLMPLLNVTSTGVAYQEEKRKWQRPAGIHFISKDTLYCCLYVLENASTGIWRKMIIRQLGIHSAI